MTRWWRLRGRQLDLGAGTRLMGIVNITPDSFSDGGRYLAPDQALKRAEELVAAGADLIDVGGESTRPGYQPVSVDVEWERIRPVLQGGITRLGVPVSVDTQKTEVARRALDHGAHIINDISGLADVESMARVLTEYGAGYVLMYNLAEPVATPISSRTIRPWLEERLMRLTQAGAASTQIVVDPGLGFAYNVENNWAVLEDLETLAGLGAGLLVGPSRKRFLGQVTGRGPEDRDVATAALAALLVGKGVDILRVHSVAMAKDAVRVAERWGRHNG